MSAYSDPRLWLGLFLPFIGTALGSALVFFMKRMLGKRTRAVLSGFAAGVMLAASVWSLLIPAIERSHALGQLAFLPAVCGFLFGVCFLLFVSRALPEDEDRCNSTFMLCFAVTLHNMPEGLAVGAAFAGAISGGEGTALPMAAALVLSLGVAIQNVPEGAIISLPLRAEGSRRMRAFACGLASGVIEPIAAIGALLLSFLVIPTLPYLLSFAAGAMVYVVVRELVPLSEAETKASGVGMLALAAGFSVMMTLDVALS